VLAPPTPIAQRGAAPGCTGAADNPVVLVGRRFNISQDQGCAQAAPVAPVSRRWPNLDECAAGPVVPVGTRHGNQDECAAEPVVRVGRRIRF
jgi:hypothetical protein